MTGTRTKPVGLAALLLTGCAGKPPPAPAPEESAAPPYGGEEPEDGPLGHRFERAEQWVDVFESPDRDEWQRPTEVIALMKIEPGMTVADLGAGTGYFLSHLSRAVGEAGKVLALDIEPDMIRYMRERTQREGLGNVEPRLVPFDDPILPDGGVDRVLVVDTWHHVPNRVRYARRLARGLRPGGAVFIVDYTMAADRGPPRHHRLRPAGVIRELEDAGLAAELLEETLPEQYVVKGSVRAR